MLHNYLHGKRVDRYGCVCYPDIVGIEGAKVMEKGGKIKELGGSSLAKSTEILRTA